MTTAITITLLVLAIASMMCNAVQYKEREIERKEANANIATLAKMEVELAEAKEKYENEVLHSKWAIGRIKDQQATIDKLKTIQPKKYHSRDMNHD